MPKKITKPTAKSAKGSKLATTATKEATTAKPAKLSTAVAVAGAAAKLSEKPPGKRGPKPKRSPDQMTDEEVGVAMAFREFGVDTDPDSSGDPLENETE